MGFVLQGLDNGWKGAGAEAEPVHAALMPSPAPWSCVRHSPSTMACEDSDLHRSQVFKTAISLFLQAMRIVICLVTQLSRLNMCQ